jgi:inhibitor of cysteine peptidase
MQVEVGEHDDVVQARVGDTVVIRLKENATTGYQWSVGDTSELVDVEYSEFTPPGQGAPGAAGERVVRIRALQGGSEVVRLNLGRSWELSSADRRDITIQIAGSDDQ